MRKFVLEELEKTREFNKELNSKVLHRRSQRGSNKIRNRSEEETRAACTKSLEHWKRLMNQGKIFFQGSRYWLMEWDD